MSKAKNNPFGDLTDMITKGNGFGDLMETNDRPVINISLDSIDIAEQVRTIFDGESLNELADSIRDVGVLQNIIVNEKDMPEGRYKLISGERRFMAADKAGLAVIPALILSVTDEVARKIQVLENVQRENLQAIELATELEKDLVDFDHNWELMQEKWKKSRSWLSKAMAMNKLTGQAEEAMTVTSDQETLLAVQQLEKLDEKKAKELVDDIKENFGEQNTRKKAQDAVREVKDDKKADQEATKAIKKQEKTETDIAAGKKPKAKKPKAGRKEEQLDWVDGQEPSEVITGKPAPDEAAEWTEEHPFFVAAFDGNKTFAISAEDRIRKVKTMDDLDILAQVKQVEGVQKSVIDAAEKRIKELEKQAAEKAQAEADKAERDLANANVVKLKTKEEKENEAFLNWVEGADLADEIPAEDEAEAASDIKTIERAENSGGFKYRIKNKKGYWAPGGMGYVQDEEKAGWFLFEDLAAYDLHECTLVRIYE